MSHDQEQRRAKVECGIGDAAHDIGGDHVAGHPDDEQLAEALIEHQFRRHAQVLRRIGGDRLLSANQVLPPVGPFLSMAGLTRDKAFVSHPQAIQRAAAPLAGKASSVTGSWASVRPANPAPKAPAAIISRRDQPRFVMKSGSLN